MKALSMTATAFAVALLAATAQATEADAVRDVLNRHYDLAAERAAEPQFFHMTTEVVHFALDGQRTGVETLGLRLKWVPGPDGGEYTCTQFTYRTDDGPEQSIPALAGWSYVFEPGPEGMGAGAEVLGIPHDRFEGLTFGDGTPVPPQVAYSVYNSFVDFHAVLDVFGRPTSEGEGGGIQDLTRIGDKVVHAAAHTQAPVNLGTNIAEGSYFKNGEVTLALKGVSIVDGAPCAVVAYDSGESSLKMIIEPMPGMKVTTVGASHYFGDLFIDLETQWPRKVTLGELVITETRPPAPAEKINMVHERELLIRSVPEAEF
jgi:hypothetical protein